ncbi:hypothetical protein RJ639_045478 [Escallonia herrerae]|uniref:Amino acid permease/ SLC12A domain-containing protein n=1 Tax=Escallonia herrerae TaxID=1293975 RepID=A0AA88W5I4_9ASTE|nr:hypothetical protein RJ639_045478 [Escallonia herrerae]
MGNGEIEGSDDNEFPPRGSSGRKYRPVVAQDGDRAVLEMSSLDPGSSPSASLPNRDNALKKIKVNVQPNMESDERQGSLPTHVGVNGSERESKLELFGFDSLVNILGLKSILTKLALSMTGEQIPAPSSPRDGEDISINLEQPKTTGVKSGTMMGEGPEAPVSHEGVVATGDSGDAVNETITKVNGTAVAEPISSPSLHDLQIYGIIVTIILCFIVFGGVKIINRVAPAFLIPVIFSLVSIFIGILVARKDHPATGITGLSLDTFKDNWSPEYQSTNNAGIPDPDGKIDWNFNAMVGLFFPAVTGIMAGSNRSASLKDTQRSIPVGTLSATLTTTGLYVVSVLLFGALATREKLFTDRLLTATVAWPLPALIYVGIILSTLGAALQSLTGAPRLLAAIANDDILPVLNYFKVADGNEPHIATFFTAFLCIACVVIGNLDLITPTITMFYLLCYAVIMFLISWSFTVVSLALASLIYYYVSIKGKAGDWGDGFKSAYFQLALRSLRSLGGAHVNLEKS